MFRAKCLVGLLTAASLLACGPEVSPGSQGDDAAESTSTSTQKQPFSSARATLLDFTFDGELYTTSGFWPGYTEQQIQDQLLYTIGHLNENESVGRLDALVLSDIKTETLPDGQTRVTYRAVLPVAWASKTNFPTTYRFTLPKKITGQGLMAFTETYGADCSDPSAHDLEAGNFWYYYRPNRARCSIAAEDVVSLEATVVVSAENSTGKYPEYDQVWADGVLEVVAIFGKYEDGATEARDAGIAAYNRFVQRLRNELRPFGVTTTPADVSYAPGVATPEVSFEAALPDGRRVRVVALLVDNVITGSPDYDFDARYSALSPTADVIAYNGHAGLGQNVRALARKGSFVPGKYLIVFMNGCDTFAYVDGSLAETRAQLNPDDPTGTKYMEIVTNAMPSYFHQMPSASIALIRALLSVENPVTYEEMFKNIDPVQVVVVTGEEDNVYTPHAVEAPVTWRGLNEELTLTRAEEKRFEATELTAGRYVFEISGKGDADLYVRRGEAPTLHAWDCRPFRGHSNERCEVELTEPGSVHVMVRGYGANATVTLVGRVE